MPIYANVNGTAKKVNSIYANVDGLSKKVSKVYIRVGGVAKLSYSASPDIPLIYAGYTTPMTYQKAWHASTSANGYLFVGGGSDLINNSYVNSRSDFVDVYDSDLLKTTSLSLSVKRDSLTASSTKDYAMFCGGSTGSASNVVDAFGADLVRSSLTLKTARYGQSSASTDEYVVVQGGYISGSSTTNSFEPISNNLVRQNSNTTHHSVAQDTGYSSGDFVYFCGGANGTTVYNSLITINNSLIKSYYNMPRNRCNHATSASGNTIIVAGGRDSTSSIPSNLTADLMSVDTMSWITSSAAISKARYGLLAEQIGGYHIFAGGTTGGFSIEQAVDIFNDTGLLLSSANMGTPRQVFSSAKLGNKVLFIGGMIGQGQYTNTIEYYEYLGG